MIGPLDIGKVDANCPRFSDVHQVAVEADMRVRAANPGLPARGLGTLIHQEIADEVRKWPEIRVAIWSEQGVFQGFHEDHSVLPRGAVRFDVLEDAGRGTVCVYDPKTGDSSMRSTQMLRYWQEAQLFRPGTTQVFVIPLYTKH
jgi:predicted double-glycine peptidase